MRTFDFAPLYRSTVGFDRMFSMLDQFDGVEASVSNYPPYNIERTGERTPIVSRLQSPASLMRISRSTRMRIG